MKDFLCHSRRVFLTTMVVCCGLLRANATILTDLQMQLGNPSNALADTNNHNNFLLQRQVQALDFDDNLGQPTWASWDLTSTDVGSSGRSTAFRTDTNLPPNFYRVPTADYTGSGLDRGHLCPSADRTDTTDDNKQVFFMSNIMPQTPDNNRGPWEQFEDYCRSQAEAGNELLIITGPSLFDGSRIQPGGTVAIPGYTWKIAVVVPPGGGSALSRITTSTRIIALKVPNITGIRTTPWGDFVSSVGQIEADTGYTFLTALPAEVAEVLRLKVDGMPDVSLSSFSPTNGVEGSTVTITGSGFSGTSIVRFNGAEASFSVDSSTTITVTVPPGVTSGPITILGPGGTTTSAASFTVGETGGDSGGGGGTGIVRISQIYGGGGNSGAYYVNDFIELYNSGTASLDLSNYAVQYASSSSSSWQRTILNGTLAPGHHYLIQEAAGSGGTASLPIPQTIGTMALSATSGKVALTSSTTLLTGSNPIGSADVVDFVGYGSANAYEGSGPAPSLSNSIAALRAGAGATDSDDNGADFASSVPTPRND